MVDSARGPSLKHEDGFALLAVIGVSVALLLFAVAAIKHVIGAQARLKHELLWPLRLETFRDSLIFRDRFNLSSKIFDLTPSSTPHALSWRRYSWQSHHYTVRWRHSWATDVALRVENDVAPLMFCGASHIRGMVQVDQVDFYLHQGSARLQEMEFRVGAPWTGSPTWDPSIITSLRQACDDQVSFATFGRRGGTLIQDSTLQLSGQSLVFRDSLRLENCTLTGLGVVACDGPVHLLSCRVMKGAELYAGGVLTLDDSTSSSECLLYSATGCTVGGRVLGYSQVVTPGFLDIRSHARLRGPNDLLVLPELDPMGSRRIRIGEHASVEGTILFLSEQEPAQDGGIVLEQDSEVTGLVLSDTWVDTRGSLMGTLITRRLGFRDATGTHLTSEMGSCNIYGPSHGVEYSLPPLFLDAISEPRFVLEER